ncbi:MAG: YtxH domain-containing protein [Cytophagales bacterium]
MSRRSDSIIAFLAGAAVGATIGILFAPEKGEVTRGKLGIRLEKYKDLLKELIAKYSKDLNISAETGEVITAAKSEGMKVVSDAKAQAEALLGDVEDLIGQIKGKRT